MECKIDRSALLAGLGIIAEAIPSRARQPILEHAFVTASETGLTLIATDTEIEIQTTVAAEVGLGGSVTLPCHKVLSICRSLPSSAALDIRLLDKGQITLKSRRSRFVVHGLDPADFPARTTDTTTDHLVVPAQMLRGILDKARQAMPQSDHRYYLNGVLFKMADGTLSAAATNGHMMIRVNTPLRESRGVAGEWIVPAKGVRALLKVLPTDAGDDLMADIAISRQAITVTVGTTRIRSQLIDGRFPDVERAIPRYESTQRITVDVDKQELEGLVERVGLMTTVNDKLASAVVLTPEAEGLRARAGSQEGEAIDSVDAHVAIPGSTSCDFGANPAYCTAILAALDTERVQLTLRDGSSGTIFHGLREGEVQEDVIGVLMPIRI